MGWWFFPNRNDDHTVLAKYLSGGPYGLGDPNDKSLRKVEKEILIPKLMRDRTKAEKCAAEVKAFGECAKREGLSVVFNCRRENDAMKSCMVRWYTDSQFKEECTQQYLADRTHYRETGIKKKRMPRGAVRLDAIPEVPT
ncbi:COX assembly mitochondrial protein homolog [Varroa jacobsoni]|uniref:COX assembly mitochondrial protein homolog n=1 Tax=Varroa jacobsoni TaxID=62625 RepID=UPI000BF859AB|nr:COX assembly mitochondrial protein homolog [Varroa jacobsoni]